MQINKFKQFLIFAIICSITSSIDAQISNLGEPRSFSEKLANLQKVPIVSMPDFDLKSLLAEDSIRESLGLKSARFAKSFNVDIDVKSKGLKEMLKDSSNIWRLCIKSSKAYSLNVIFNDYILPPNAEVYIYSIDKVNKIGAFTNINNHISKRFATSPIKGEVVVVELHEPKNPAFSSHVTIGTVNHDYKDIFNMLNKRGVCCGYNQSGTCENDINCAIGSNWQQEKHSVCRIIINGTGYCTGSLINNTNNDGRLLLVTANHCYEDYSDLNAAANNSIFYFEYESPSCNGGDGLTTNSISGATYRANWANSDFFLEELNSRPGGENLYFEGWDRNNNAASNETGIHHPLGDVKKISTSSNALTSTAWSSNTINTSANHWRIVWSSGVTEGGSSGSPLYNQDHLVVGQLHGGGSSCTATTSPDWYGKLFSSWTGAGTSSTRLSNWLDPIGSNVTTLNGISQIQILPTNCHVTNIQNQTFNSGASYTDCGINVTNVTIQNNSNLNLNGTTKVIINGPFTVQPGSTLTVQ